MLKRKTRTGLIGAAVAGATVLAVWACTPAAVPTGNNGPTDTNVVTPASQKGQVKVAVELPTDTRQVQAILDTLNSIDLAVSSSNWSPPLKATIAKGDLANNTASKTFSDVPTGAATVAAAAKDAAGAELATASATVTVVADQTINTTLTLRFKSGDIAATIDVIVTSPVVIGEHGALQSGATYVGQAACIACHSDIGAKFKETAHYKGVRDSKTGLLRYPAQGRPSCAQCHAVGTYAASYGSAIPYDFITKSATDSPNDLVSTISCEACHGPGSKHIVAKYGDRFKTITRVPNFANTCAKCHTGYSKQYDAAGKPVMEPIAGSTNQVYNPADFPATGAPEEAYMARGGHNALGMGPTAAVINQTGGYTGGVAVSFSNAHKTQTANGCVSCHMAGQGPEKHSFSISPASGSVIVNSCQKCHGTGFTEESLVNFQGQTKMAIAKMEDMLKAYRTAFCKETVKKAYTGVVSDKSTDSAKIADLSRVPSLWDDSDDYVKNATVSASMDWTDKANWTDGGNHWSNHQKVYNRAYWNYSLVKGEGSYGVHAPTYTQYLLRNSYNELATALNTEASASFSLMSLK